MSLFALEVSRNETPEPDRARYVVDQNYYGIPTEELFNHLLSLERKRTERSGKPFVLMLARIGRLSRRRARKEIARVVRALLSATRETDIGGWYKTNSTIGVIFTEIGCVDRDAVIDRIHGKVQSALRGSLDLAQVNNIKLSLYYFPEESDQPGSTIPKLYPDLVAQERSQRSSLVVKRIIDIVGSLCALILFSPLFLVIPVLIKLASRGPVLYKHRRLGQFGKEFLFLKFRSMHVGSQHEIHREYVKTLIDGKNSTEGVYKIQDDPRVTRLGRFLRKSSLDELPQFLNVLKGEMSLVGPRPPIPYEFECYSIWHRRRVLESKPGITGLWQVKGRSRTTFDQMVRLDLEYVRRRTIWLDLLILLMTPKAVLSGDGAY